MTRLNPLIDYPDLPPFDRIEAADVTPAVETLIEAGRKAIDQVVAAGDYSWVALAQLDHQEARLDKAFGPAAHLNAVTQTPALREAFNACLPKLSAYGTEVGQNQALYKAYRQLHDSEEYTQLNEAQRKQLDNTLRDFTLSGVALPADKQKQFSDNAVALSRLTSQFSDNLLDATQSWSKQITDAEQLQGMPEAALAAAADSARQEGIEGWRLSLDFPCYFAVMSHCTNRALRREMHFAHSTRASEIGPDQGKFDNSEVMQQIVALRHQQAQLLGYDNYAARSLATKMAPSPRAVFDFLNDLAKRALPQAKQEFQELKDYAADHGVTTLEPWDLAFWSQRLREQTFNFSEEALRPWFPMEKVLSGLFEVVNRLYGIVISPREDVASWHSDVRYFDIKEAEGKIIAGFYLDAYARTGKRGGAWMDDCLVRSRKADGSLQVPVAYLACNLAPPAGGKPGLLTHDEVVTLFHEFGHGLHHMLTEQEVAGVSGINGVAWDAVELPSQFMENWCWQREGIALISGHYETGEALPDEMLDRMLAAKNFHSAMAMMRQLEFSLFDFSIHANYRPDQDIQLVLDEVREQVSAVPVADYSRFQHGFGHIFAGGYAAGYYSYKWAEVLSADAFSRFEEEGIFNAATGNDFRRQVLAKGGSRDAMALFTAFRGREPSVDALLRHSGINAA